MDATEFLLFGVIGLIIWIFILKAVIKSATQDIIRILVLIAEKQGASEDEIFRATKTKDEIYARELMLKRELKKKQKQADIQSP
jgi:hypothetical protein